MTKDFEITLKQSRLMRHALGLDYDKKSFRNHYACCPGCDDHKRWMELVDAGFATVRKSHPLNPDMDCFRVNFAGAKAVVESKESLCKEDFPEQH